MKLQRNAIAAAEQIGMWRYSGHSQAQRLYTNASASTCRFFIETCLDNVLMFNLHGWDILIGNMPQYY